MEMSLLACCCSKGPPDINQRVIGFEEEEGEEEEGEGANSSSPLVDEGLVLLSRRESILASLSLFLPFYLKKGSRKGVSPTLSREKKKVKKKKKKKKKKKGKDDRIFSG